QRSKVKAACWAGLSTDQVHCDPDCRGLLWWRNKVNGFR
ncbi:hypothetical protein FQN60_008596, partial [Etheostoma spectabile]